MASKKIQKDHILEASIAVIEEMGCERLSVRNIAMKLQCSTQPIYSEFQSIKHLKEALVPYISECYLKTTQISYKAFALSFLYFAKDHKELFKFFYLRRRFSLFEVEDINQKKIVSLLAKALELPMNTAAQLHQKMQTYCYALGVMLASGYREMSEEQIDEELVDTFRIVLCYYKNIQTKEEYEYWLEKTHHLDV